MRPQPGKQTLVILISANNPRSKDKQTMKFNQLIEYNIRNIFLKNHTQAVFSTCIKIQDKKLNILRTKRAFRMK